MDFKAQKLLKGSSSNEATDNGWNAELLIIQQYCLISTD